MPQKQVKFPLGQCAGSSLSTHTHAHTYTCLQTQLKSLQHVWAATCMRAMPGTRWVRERETLTGFMCSEFEIRFLCWESDGGSDGDRDDDGEWWRSLELCYVLKLILPQQKFLCSLCKCVSECVCEWVRCYCRTNPLFDPILNWKRKTESFKKRCSGRTRQR